MKQSLVTGVSIGATTGAIAGASSHDDNKQQQAVRGALIGAALGGFTSYLIHGSLEKEMLRQESKHFLI
ncbi:MAG: glycine zipper domain-containing protein [Bdellovibrionota bacterium]